MKNNYPLVDFKDFVFFQEGPGIRSYEYIENGCKMINVKCVKDGQLDLSDTKFVSWDKINKDWKHFLVDEDDILVTTSGTIGRVAKVNKKDLPILMNTSVIRFRPLDKDKIDSDYLMFFLRSGFFYKQLQKQATQMCVKNVGPTHIKKMKLILPPLPDQKGIVKILEKADAIRKKRQEANEASNDMIRSIFLEMFGGASKREKMSIKEVCTLINGKAFKPSDWTDNGLKIVRIQNLNDETKPFNYYNGPVRERFLINSGDILISWSGTPGTSFGCFIWNRGEAVLNQHIFKTVIKKDVVNEVYFVAAINNILNEMINKAHGGVGLRHITKGDLEAIKIIVPLLSQQQKFADFVQKVEKIKESQRESGEKIDILFNSLLAQEFK